MSTSLADRFARLRRGLTLPVELRRKVLADAAAARRYRRVVWAQAAITVTVGALLAGLVFFFALWLMNRPGTTVAWSEAGLSIHSGEPPPGTIGSRLDEDWRIAAGLAYVLFGTLTLVEGVVIALPREHHDQVGRDAALLAGTEPEDPEAAPRVRLDLRWLWNKVKRKVRGFRTFASGLPVMAVVLVVPVVGSYAYGAVTFVWSLYWLAVFAGAKSAKAWRETPPPREPLFIVALRRIPVLRWYAGLWSRQTKAVFAPCNRVEERPFELAGLAMARLLGTLPVLYLFFRPFFPVAAASIVGERGEAASDQPAAA